MTNYRMGPYMTASDSIQTYTATVSYKEFYTITLDQIGTQMLDHNALNLCLTYLLTKH